MESEERSVSNVNIMKGGLIGITCLPAAVR